MEDDDIVRSIRDLIAGIVAIGEGEFSNEDDLFKIGAVDSFTMAKVLVALNRKFELNLTLKDFSENGCRSINDLKCIVKKKM